MRCFFWDSMRKDSFIALNLTTVLFVLLSGCAKDLSLKNDEREYISEHYGITKNASSQLLISDDTHDRVMIVLIHGTILPIPSFSGFFRTLYTVMSQGYKLNKSVYQIYLDSLRQSSIFQYQPVGKMGLDPITPEQQSSHEIATFYKKLDTLIDERPREYLFYTFGWSGRLDSQERQRAGYELYHALVRERERLLHQNPDKNLKIVLAGHSHGGNVLLNLGPAEDLFKRSLKVDQALLLGTPIQQETAPYVSSSVFDKIYNIYSGGDSVQVLDIFSTQGYSYRRFDNLQASNQLHSKLVQLEVKIGKKKYPSHTELWFYGAPGNYFYRSHLAIYPYPVLAYCSAIISLLERHLDVLSDVRVNLHKKNDIVALSYYKPNKDYPRGKEFLKRYMLHFDGGKSCLEMGRVQRE